MSAATASASALEERKPIPTAAPSEPKALATAPPSVPPPPVTSATLPSKRWPSFHWEPILLPSVGGLRGESRRWAPSTASPRSRLERDHQRREEEAERSPR